MSNERDPDLRRQGQPVRLEDSNTDEDRSGSSRQARVSVSAQILRAEDQPQPCVPGCDAYYSLDDQAQMNDEKAMGLPQQRAPTEKEFRGLPVHGYQPQSGTKVQMANRIKVLEERLLREVEALIDNRADCDTRSAAIAKTEIQTGCMWAIRAIFRPQRLELPEEGRNGNDPHRTGQGSAF